MAKSGRSLCHCCQKSGAEWNISASGTTITSIFSTITQHSFPFAQTSLSKVLCEELCVLFVGKGLAQSGLFIDNAVNLILKTRRKAIQTVAAVTLIYYIQPSHALLTCCLLNTTTAHNQSLFGHCWPLWSPPFSFADFLIVNL